MTHAASSRASSRAQRCSATVSFSGAFSSRSLATAVIRSSLRVMAVMSGEDASMAASARVAFVWAGAGTSLPAAGRPAFLRAPVPACPPGDGGGPASRTATTSWSVSPRGRASPAVSSHSVVPAPVSSSHRTCLGFPVRMTAVSRLSTAAREGRFTNAVKGRPVA